MKSILDRIKSSQNGEQMIDFLAANIAIFLNFENRLFYEFGCGFSIVFYLFVFMEFAFIYYCRMSN